MEKLLFVFAAALIIAAATWSITARRGAQAAIPPPQLSTLRFGDDWCSRCGTEFFYESDDEPANCSRAAIR